MRLELVTGTTGALVDRVLREEIEAAFVAEPFPTRDLETRHAFSEELVLITPRDHPRVGAPRDLGSRTVLAFPTGCSYRRRLETGWGARSVVAERVMEYGSYHAIVACVAAGGGIAVVPRSVLRASGMEPQVGCASAAGEDRAGEDPAGLAARPPLERARRAAREMLK